MSIDNLALGETAYYTIESLRRDKGKIHLPRDSVLAEHAWRHYCCKKAMSADPNWIQGQREVIVSVQCRDVWQAVLAILQSAPPEKTGDFTQ